MKAHPLKVVLATMILLLEIPLLADQARVCIQVLDFETSRPVAGSSVKAWFEEDIGWRAWSETTPIRTQMSMTDAQGRCVLSGNTNTGCVSFEAKKVDCYYRSGSWHKYDHKNILGVWQPDNLVVTIRLQRVEHPIPLFVKRVELHDSKEGIFGKKGPAGVLRFDLMMGDWLPPYGHGVHGDLEISSTMTITGKDRKYRSSSRREEVVFFSDYTQNILLSSNDCLCAVQIEHPGGIKIRNGSDSGRNMGVVRRLGTHKRVEKFGDWYRDRHDDFDESRCYTFRIRSRYDDKGDLIEAYYGKIYGDFEFDYKEDVGLTRVRFLYYLNTVSLDKNLEWNMKTNLCAEPGNVDRAVP